MKIVGVAWSGDTSSYEGFVAKHGISFINIDDTPGDVYAEYEIPYQPAWVFIDADGTVTRRLGAMSQTELDSNIAELGR